MVTPIEHLKSVVDDMDVEPEGFNECHPIINGKPLSELPISEAQMPGGKKIKLLKSMLTTACERNCNYCAFRAGRNRKRSTIKPDDMAKTFIAVHDAGLVEGLFLSSGIIKGGPSTQDKLIDTVEIIRHKYHYRGYIHLKIMPGAERDQVKRAMQLASRVSVNLEGPNPGRLKTLAPLKDFTHELLAPLKWMEEIRREQSPHSTWNDRWASSITQLVIGAAGENDLELLSTSEYLYRQASLKRIYYSAFSPIPDTPFENLPAENPTRQHRLYQASFLLRDYGYGLEEMPFAPNGNLPLDTDPKLAWAKANLAHEPIEINRAHREELLRIPGIGPKGAMKVLLARRKGKLHELDDLRRLGVYAVKAAPFILIDGKQPAHQLQLFA